MKLESSELHCLNDLIREKRRSKDPYSKEKLNQYMEDLRNKYHLTFEDSVELETGEILRITSRSKRDA